MTLEELLKDIENKKACAATDYKECLAREHGCEDCPFDHVGIDLLYPEIIERLEELKALRNRNTHKRPKAQWIQSGSEKFYCSNCDNLRNVHDYYCEHCGSEMFDDNGNIIITEQ